MAGRDPTCGRLEEGERVCYRVEQRQATNFRGDLITLRDARDVRKSGRGTIGYVMLGEQGVTKKCNGVFALQKNEEEIARLREDTHIRMFESVLKSYRDEKVNKNLKNGHNGYKAYREAWDKFKRGKGEEYFPVYYSKVDKLIYLSPACMTKEAYQNRLNQILKAQGNFQCCTDSAELCPACSLFGMTGKSSRASSVRFADARLRDKVSDYRALYHRPVVLEELAQPKISAAEFYLQKPDVNAAFWTYDYYVAGKQIVGYLPRIAGRKFYWHNPGMQFKESVEATDRNRTVRPLKKGVSFEEEVYFDKITEKQLRQLIAILDVSRSGEMGYKLGAAKPLGLGSVAMTVEGIRLRRVSLCDGGVRYEETPYPVEASFSDWEELDFTAETREAFLHMMRFDATKGMTVTYPVTEDQWNAIQVNQQHLEGFKWFVANHGGQRVQTRKNSKYLQTLQSPARGDVSLTALQSGKGGRGSYGQNRQGSGGNRQGSGPNRQGYGGNRKSYGSDRQRSDSNRYDNSDRRRNDGGKPGNGKRWNDSDKKNHR
ncbi:MAG: TIGR03986 family CRISPR-associated RAMP protein [Lachnospiraceae bacterium]|nr:TIGR03986 family CRISPR-associated RAMP protein [Lachnospiraceae bacterium]